jgi:hypothetical protein
MAAKPTMTLAYLMSHLRKPPFAQRRRRLHGDCVENGHLTHRSTQLAAIRPILTSRNRSSAFALHCNFDTLFRIFRTWSSWLTKPGSTRPGRRGASPTNAPEAGEEIADMSDTWILVADARHVRLPAFP